MSGFGSLRWDDQENIRKRIKGEGEGTDSTDGPAPSTKGKRVTTRSDLTVEYAKSNRSTCKGCSSQIDKVSKAEHKISLTLWLVKCQTNNQFDQS